MKKVKFRQMKEATTDDYALLESVVVSNSANIAGIIMAMLRRQSSMISGYQVDQLEHSLQCATRAERDGADEETVVCALLHDIAVGFAPYNHASVAAEILKPYVSPANCWMIEHHGIFQHYYFGELLGLDKNERDQFNGHIYFDKTEQFCELWDQASFDPDYDTLPLEYFEPKVHSIFGRKAWSADRYR